MSERLFVHLDHLISREDIFYTSPRASTLPERNSKKDEVIRYVDIQDGRALFKRLRKPDFQRQTNAWTPDKCVDFLDSILRGWLVPHIILWKKPGTETRYILDGAHRVSVVKAWMENDWGDSVHAKKHYAKQDRARIEEAADRTRALVKRRIGNFKEFQAELEELHELNDLQIFQLPPQKRLLLEFFNSIDDTGLLIHWAENNSYEDVAQSFVRINRGGQPLDEFEVFLIDNRKSAFVRSIMAIAGGGTGSYWPAQEDLSNGLKEMVTTFNKIASDIHQRLFEPTHELPPTDVNQPFMPTPPYFRKHLYLRETLPILVSNEIVRGKTGFNSLVSRDEYNTTPESVIRSSYKILSHTDNKLKHLTSITNTEPLSLDIVPLFYWYNRRGQLVRALCYGFMYWMLKGNENDIRARKIIFSGNRDRFEYILHTLKPQIASIHFAGGAALNTTGKTANFFQRLLELLHETPDTEAGDLLDRVRKIVGDIAPTEPEEAIAIVSNRRSGRNTSLDTHGKINRLFKSNHRCHICGGHIDWKRKHQLDHVEPYKKTKITTAEGLEETHQFCNNNRDTIESYKKGVIKISLPKEKEEVTTQLELILSDSWEDEDEFPFVENETEAEAEAEDQ
jgi:hypothetical protein